MAIQISLKQAPSLLMNVLTAGLAPMVCSSPGIGKSDIARKIAKEQNLKMIDVRLSQCDPSDLLGFPRIDKHTQKDGTIIEKAGYVPMETFPIEGDALPLDDNGNEMDGWLLFLDEMNSAPLSVQAASYKIVLDREVGIHSLHPNVAIMAAGNLATDKAIVSRMSTAMQSRMVHFELAIDNDAWLDWAADAGIDYRIIAYINWRPENLHNFDPNHSDKTFPCPRTWHFLSKIVKPMKEISMDKAALLAGTVGEGAGMEFRNFCDIFESLPTLTDILAAPGTIEVPREPSVLYALTGMLTQHIEETNIGKLMLLINRLPIEFQVISLQGVLKRNRKLIAEKSVKEWVVKNSQELL
jgi:hypothetical protein